jgi:hypothetical protein
VPPGDVGGDVGLGVGAGVVGDVTLELAAGLDEVAAGELDAVAVAVAVACVELGRAAADACLV